MLKRLKTIRGTSNSTGYLLYKKGRKVLLRWWKRGRAAVAYPIICCKLSIFSVYGWASFCRTEIVSRWCLATREPTDWETRNVLVYYHFRFSVQRTARSKGRIWSITKVLCVGRGKWRRRARKLGIVCTCVKILHVPFKPLCFFICMKHENLSRGIREDEDI